MIFLLAIISGNLIYFLSSSGLFNSNSFYNFSVINFSSSGCFFLIWFHKLEVLKDFDSLPPLRISSPQFSILHFAIVLLLSEIVK